MRGPEHEARPGASFRYDEFKSRDRASLPVRYRPAVDDLVAIVLQPMRDRYGPCTVHSGHRTKARNDLVGGAPRSHHRYGLHPGIAGADVSFATGSPRQWAHTARMLLGQRGGVGTYPGHVHVDLRSQRADW